MNISIDKNGTELMVVLEGRLDSNTSPELESNLGALDDGITVLHFDFTKLLYISSAGLRILLASQKKMNAAGGEMVVHNPNELILEVFDATGFLDILTIRND